MTWGIHLLRDAASGMDCLAPFPILRVVMVGLRKWILVVLSKVAAFCRDFQIVICGLLWVGSYIYCPSFTVISLMVWEKNSFENCHLKYSLLTLLYSFFI